MTHQLILFLFTFLAAFAASAPPGLLNVNAAKTSVQHGKRNGFMFGFGVAVMVMIQAYLAVRIAKYLSRNPDVVENLMRFAVVLFAVLAVFYLAKGLKKNHKKKVTKERKMRNSFSYGMFLGALNLLQVPFYSGLNSFFHSKQIMKYDVMDEVFFILGAGLGTFGVMYSYAFYFNKLEMKTSRFSKNSNFILSALMLVLLVLTIAKLYNQ